MSVNERLRDNAIERSRLKRFLLQIIIRNQVSSWMTSFMLNRKTTIIKRNPNLISQGVIKPVKVKDIEIILKKNFDER